MALSWIGIGHYLNGNLNKAEAAWVASKALVSDSSSPSASMIHSNVEANLKSLISKRTGEGGELSSIAALKEEARSQAQKLLFQSRQQYGEHHYFNPTLQEALRDPAQTQLRTDIIDPTNFNIATREEFRQLAHVYDQTGKNISIPRAQLLQHLELQRSIHSSEGEIASRTMLAVDAVGREDWKESLQHWTWLESTFSTIYTDTPRRRVDRAWLMCESTVASMQLKDNDAVLRHLESAEKLLLRNEETREERAAFLQIYSLYMEFNFSFESAEASPINLSAGLYIRYLLYLNDPTTAVSSHVLRAKELMPEKMSARQAAMKQRQGTVLAELIRNYVLGERFVDRLDTTQETVKDLANCIGCNWFKLERFFFMKVCPVLAFAFKDMLDQCRPEDDFFPDEKYNAALAELVQILFTPRTEIGNLEFFDDKYQKGLRTKWPAN